MNQPLADILQSQRDTIINAFIREASQGNHPFYESMPQEERRERIGTIIAVFVQSLTEGAQLLADAMEEIVHLRVSEGARPDEIQQTLEYLRSALQDTLDATPNLDTTKLLAYNRAIEQNLHAASLATNRAFSEYFTRAQKDLIEREHVIQIQNRLISELSTPVLPVHNRILVMPLVGIIDSQRANQFLERMLLAIGDYQAETIIVDITGVPFVDTAVANHLVQAAHAAMLLGADCVLVGIRPEVAQSLVGLGVDISTMVTRSDLQAGIEYALRRQGLAVDRIDI